MKVYGIAAERAVTAVTNGLHSVPAGIPACTRRYISPTDAQRCYTHISLILYKIEFSAHHLFPCSSREDISCRQRMNIYVSLSFRRCTMRSTISLAAAVCIAAASWTAAAQSSNAPRAGNRLESPCVILLGAIERHQSALEGTRDRLVRLARAAGEPDRERIQRFMESTGERVDALHERYADALEQIQSMSPEKITEECSRIRAQLSNYRNTLGKEVDKAREFERDVRARVATRKRVQRALRITDDMLRKAARMVRATENGEDAFPGMRRGYEVQENARQAFAAGRFEAAARLTVTARDILGETIRASLDEQDREQVRDYAAGLYRRTAAAIERIAVMIDPASNPKAARLLEMGKEELARARELTDERPYVAVRHLQRARRIVGEMRRFYFRATNCEDRIGRQEEKLAEARDAVEESGDPRALDVLEKALEHHERGAGLCESGEAAQATVQFDIAAKLTVRAVERAKDISRADKAMAREIKKTALIVKKAGERAAGDEQKMRIARAEELVVEARERIDQPQVCLKLLDKATDIAFSVLAQGRRGSTPDGRTTTDQ